MRPLLAVIAGFVVAPFVVVGYLALAGVFFLPLLVVRSFSRPIGPLEDA